MTTDNPHNLPVTQPAVPDRECTTQPTPEQLAIKELMDWTAKQYMNQFARPYRLTNANFEKLETGWVLKHQGIEAHGDTPAMAAENFDNLWMFGEYK